MRSTTFTVDEIKFLEILGKEVYNQIGNTLKKHERVNMQKLNEILYIYDTKPGEIQRKGKSSMQESKVDVCLNLKCLLQLLSVCELNMAWPIHDLHGLCE